MQNENGYITVPRTWNSEGQILWLFRQKEVHTYEDPEKKWGMVEYSFIASKGALA